MPRIERTNLGKRIPLRGRSLVRMEKKTRNNATRVKRIRPEKEKSIPDSSGREKGSGRWEGETITWKVR